MYQIAPFLSVPNTFFKFLTKTCKLIILHPLDLYFNKIVSVPNFSASEQSKKVGTENFGYFNFFKMLAKKTRFSCDRILWQLKLFELSQYQTYLQLTNVHFFGFWWLFSTFKLNITDGQIFKQKLTVINFSSKIYVRLTIIVLIVFLRPYPWLRGMKYFLNSSYTLSFTLL